LPRKPLGPSRGNDAAQTVHLKSSWGIFNGANGGAKRSCRMVPMSLPLIYRLLAALLLATANAFEEDPLRTAILSKPRELLDAIAEKAGLRVAAGAGDDVVRALVYEFAQNEKPAHLPRYTWSGEAMPTDAGVAGGGAGGADGGDASEGVSPKMRKIRLKTSGQLKSMLAELKIDFPSKANKEVPLRPLPTSRPLTRRTRAPWSVQNH